MFRENVANEFQLQIHQIFTQKLFNFFFFFNLLVQTLQTPKTEIFELQNNQ